MTHEACRTAVLNDEVGGEAEEHLTACADCRRFRADVARIVAVAPTLYAAPEGLADRALAALSTSPADVDNARLRRSLLTSAAIAAALLLVLGIVAVVQQRTKPEAPLLAAATATEKAGSARMELGGDVQVSIAAPQDGSDPQFDRLPPELESYFVAQWRRIEEEFNRAMAQFERQVNEAMDRFNRQIEEFTRRFGGSGSSAPSIPAPTPPTSQPPPRRPLELSLGLRISGQGSVDFDGALGIDGAVAKSGGTVDNGVPFQAGFRLAVRGDEVGLRGPDGAWHRLPEAAGPIGKVVLQPDAVPELLRQAKDVQFAGQVELDGESLRHYRFRADGYDAEAWIGDDDRVRRLSATTKGDTWTTTVAVRLFGYGADVEVEAPPAASEAGAPSNAGLVLYPFGAPVRAALTAR